MTTSRATFATWMANEIGALAASLETREVGTLWPEFGQRADAEWWSHGMRHMHLLQAPDVSRIDDLVQKVITRGEFAGLHAETTRELVLEIVAQVADGEPLLPDLGAHMIRVLLESVEPRWHITPLSGFTVESTQCVGPVSILPDLDAVVELLRSDSIERDLSFAEHGIATVAESRPEISRR